MWDPISRTCVRAFQSCFFEQTTDAVVYLGRTASTLEVTTSNFNSFRVPLNISLLKSLILLLLLIFGQLGHLSSFVLFFIQEIMQQFLWPPSSSWTHLHSEWAERGVECWCYLQVSDGFSLLGQLLCEVKPWGNTHAPAPHKRISLLSDVSDKWAVSRLHLANVIS